MTGNAMIRVTTHDEYNPLTDETASIPTYHWEGPIDAPFKASRRLVQDLPWPVQVIQEDFAIDGGLYVRTDVRWWRVTAARYAARRAWAWLSWRLLLTLAVWGLAETRLGEIPNWRDVRWPGRRRRG